MKIVFLAPMHATEQMNRSYIQMIDYLVKAGHTVTHALTSKETTYLWTNESASEYFAQFYAKIARCDLVIAECSLPNMQLGYELACAAQVGKGIVLLKMKDLKSTGYPSDPFYLYRTIHTYEYVPSNLIQTLKSAMDETVSLKYPISFSPEMVTKVTKLARARKISKSMCINQLLRQSLELEK